MPNILKSVSGAVGDQNWTTLYTATAPTIVRSVIATNDAHLTPTAHLGVRANGVDTPLASTVGVPNGTSVNMLAGTLVLNAGESIVGRTQAGGSMFRVTGIAPMGTIATMVANVNTIIATTDNGIWRSTDEGETWAQVNTTTGTNYTRLAYIGTSWFAYNSATNALCSTDDGLTWSVQAVTNAPTLICNTTGNIVRAGSTWAGLFSTTVMSTTADGITWTQQTAFPAVVNTLCWSGTHYIAGRSSTAAEIYRSTNGAAWATVNTGGGTPALVKRILASNGSGTVLFNLPTENRFSTDHGVTWANLDGPTPGATVTWTGSVFLSPAANFNYVSSSGASNTWSLRKDSITISLGVLAILPNKVLFVNSANTSLSTSLALPGVNGLYMTASMMEVS